MAEIEEFLLQKLTESIERTKSCTIKASLLFNLHDDCKELMDIIKAEAPKTGASLERIRREKLHYLNNIMSEWEMLLKKKSHSPQEILLVRNLHQNLNQIRKELQGDIDKSESVRDVIKPSFSEVYRWSSPSVDPKKIHGIEDKVMIMQRLLVSKETKGFRAIGIVGMAGVGKTALCKVVFNNEQVKKQFLPRIWVSLSKQPNDDEDYRTKVVKRILVCLGLDDTIIGKLNEGGGGGLQKLLVALRQKLEGKKYLIMLDDVWNLEEEVQKFCSLVSDDEKVNLSFGLPKGNGGTVIITSRSEKLAENMVGKKNITTLLPLANKESCWEIFKDAVKKDGILPPDDKMKMLKAKILENSVEVPLIAKMMGQIVHEKIHEESKGKLTIADI